MNFFRIILNKNRHLSGTHQALAGRRVSEKGICLAEKVGAGNGIADLPGRRCFLDPGARIAAQGLALEVPA